MIDQIYHKQAELILRLLPVIDTEKAFALKGGTAINFFIRDMPRFSVDIDLTYIKVNNRQEALAEISSALKRITDQLKKHFGGIRITPKYLTHSNAISRLFLAFDEVTVKCEPNLILRGTILPVGQRNVSSKVEDFFKLSSSIQVLAVEELYAGKICAALDRQHPRDLFDIMLLLEEGDLSVEMWKAFIVYLISGNRPISELLAPHFKEIEMLYKNDFKGMTIRPVELKDLLVTREQLIKLVRERLSDRDRQFLISFKKGEPDWSFLDLKNVERLPAVQWKLLNIKKMDREKHLTALRSLEKVLTL